MPDTWHEFYFMLGSSAAALIGLLFVVTTLTASFNPAVTLPAARIYVTPTVFHFASIVLVSAVSLAPAAGPGLIGVVLIACGAGGLAYAASVALNFFGRFRPNITHWTDPLFFAVLPALAHLGLVLAGFAFLRHLPAAPNVAATAVVALLLLGIRDAWDVALWVSTHPQQTPEDSAPAPRPDKE
jgi:hypothetical protein